MKNFYVFYVLFILFGACNSPNTEDKNEIFESGDSIFNDFISQFELKKLPDSFVLSNKHIHFKNRSIPDSLCLKYLCDEVNYCKRTRSYQGAYYSYYRSYSIDSIFTAIVYDYVNQPLEHKIILATYSKETGRIINKFVLFAFDYHNYLIQSWLHKDGTIDLLTIFDIQYMEEIQFPDHPKYTIVEEYKDTYKIFTGGYIKLLKTERNRYVAKKTKDGGYIYPVEAPIENYNMFPQTRKEFWDPLNQLSDDTSDTR